MKPGLMPGTLIKTLNDTAKVARKEATGKGESLILTYVHTMKGLYPTVSYYSGLRKVTTTRVIPKASRKYQTPLNDCYGQSTYYSVQSDNPPTQALMKQANTVWLQKVTVPSADK
jgi:hypothetical protein